MRCLTILALLAAALSAADIQIDHVTVAGSDVKKLQAGLSAVGIPSVYGGAHTNGTTEMALSSFPDGSYLELMGLQAKADARLVDEHVWGKFLKGNAGPCAWAVREKDMAAEVKRLQGAGITVAAPEHSGRARPDGVRLEWETSNVGDEGGRTFFPVGIHDFTPHDQRAFPQKKPITRDFKGVTKVIIAVRNLDDAIKRYRQAYGEPAVALDRVVEAPCAFVLRASAPGHYRAVAVSKTRWFGVDVSWFDTEKLGWRLGFEAVP